ncbi:MAG TPA: phosphopantothenoylcysteine decarboxylase [Candidatus Omnitrophota bacterium]|nr:phosphopantothenoylcysteine decarboxylase [Candidatus Omnitrophota bacterium]
MAWHNPLKNKKVLITSGPTWVALDGVRVISNRSSGQLGRLIAGECVKAGAKVTVLQGPVNETIELKKVTLKPFTFFDELEDLITSELKKPYNVVIHAAAVSDFRPKQTWRKKLGSGKKINLALVPTKKLIESVKRINPKLLLVGFKLEPKVNERTAASLTKDLFKKAKCDLVVANSANGKKYHGYLLNNKGKCLSKAHSRPQMAQALVKQLKGFL